MPEAVTVRPVQQIHALTGVRIVAALWVVAFHVRGNLASEFPTIYPYFAPLIIHGEFGVDLFFMLSGYVLALNYGRRMGVRLERSATAKFWWARLARVWPAYFATLMFAAVWHGIFLAIGVNDPVAPRDYSVWSFLRQTGLFVLWTEPDFDRLTWNGAAWSVSAEALAYLLFPVVALLVFRLSHALGARGLMITGFVVISPIVILAAAMGSLYAPWMWLLRILCSFLAGAIIYFGLERLGNTSRVRLGGSIGAIVAVVAIIGLLYLSEAIHRPVIALLAIPAMLVLIASLAVGDRWVVAGLGLKIFVIGGMASYSIYLVHMPLIEILWTAQGVFPFLAPGTIGSKIAFILLPVVVVGVGYCLWRFFEEPARRAMRRMSLQHIPERAVDDVPPAKIDQHSPVQRVSD